jgi:hypothetical protein
MTFGERFYRFKSVNYVEIGSNSIASLDNPPKTHSFPVCQCAILLSQHFAIVLLLLNLGIGSLAILRSHPPATSPAPQEQGS